MSYLRSILISPTKLFTLMKYSPGQKSRNLKCHVAVSRNPYLPNLKEVNYFIKNKNGKKSYYFLNNKNGRLNPQLVNVQRIGTVGCSAQIRPVANCPSQARRSQGVRTVSSDTTGQLGDELPQL